jgi:predicted Zn-dependent protease
MLTCLLILVGCSYPEEVHVTVQLDERWSDSYLLTIREAFQAWDHATRITKATLVPGWKREPFQASDLYQESDLHILFLASEHEPGMLELRKEQEDFLGFAAFGESMVIAADHIESEASLFDTLLHEIGHMYGVDHVEDENSIMNSHAGHGGSCIDQATINAFCELYTCGVVSPCIMK